MATKKKPAILLKFFKEKAHLDQLYKEGLLFMNTLQYFRNLEPDGQRADKDEGTFEIRQANKSPMFLQNSFGGEPFALSPSGGFKDAKITLHQYLLNNLYCLARVSEEDHTLDERLYAFGKHVLCIMDVPNFLGRLEEVVRQDNKEIKYGRIQYVPRSYNGKLLPFKKFEEKFKHQKEYRIYIYPGDGSPYTPAIGSLKEIATPLNSQNLEGFLIQHFKN